MTFILELIEVLWKGKGGVGRNGRAVENCVAREPYELY